MNINGGIADIVNLFGSPLLIVLVIAGTVGAFGGIFFRHGVSLIARQANETRAAAIGRIAGTSPRDLRLPLFHMALGTFLVALAIRILTQVMPAGEVLLIVLGITLGAIAWWLFRRHRNGPVLRRAVWLVRAVGIVVAVFIGGWMLLSTLYSP